MIHKSCRHLHVWFDDDVAALNVMDERRTDGRLCLERVHLRVELPPEKVIVKKF